MYDKYFDEKTINEMHNHDHKDAAGNTTSVEDAWTEWTSQLKTLLDMGADPLGKEAQALMSHWQDLVTHLTAGDKEKLKAFNDLFHNEPQARRDHGVDDAMFEFMGKATIGH